MRKKIIKYVSWTFWRLLRGIYRCSVIKTLYLQKRKKTKKSSFLGLYQKLPYWQVDQTLLGVEVAVIVFCHEILRKTQNWSYEVFPLKAALYMSNVSQELKQKCTFYFCEVNLYVFVFCFFSRGSWIKIVGGFLGICLGKWNYKWFIVQLSLSLSNGIKFNLDEK